MGGDSVSGLKSMMLPGWFCCMLRGGLNSDAVFCETGFAMRIAGTIAGRMLCLFIVSAAFAQTSGLTQRVPNTTLQMPASPPAYGYAITNAFGNLSFLNPVAIVSPPGETNRLFI